MAGSAIYERKPDSDEADVVCINNFWLYYRKLSFYDVTFRLRWSRSMQIIGCNRGVEATLTEPALFHNREV